jgi:hypothetical protein
MALIPRDVPLDTPFRVDLDVRLVYRHLDGKTTSWPGGKTWDPGAGLIEPEDDVDLMVLRTLLVRALRKVDAEAVKRGLIPGSVA